MTENVSILIQGRKYLTAYRSQGKQPGLYPGLAAVPKQLDSWRGLFGLFYEYNARSLDDLAEFVNDKFQTVTTFGVDRKLIAD